VDLRSRLFADRQLVLAPTLKVHWQNVAAEPPHELFARYLIDRFRLAAVSRFSTEPNDPQVKPAGFCVRGGGLASCISSEPNDPQDKPAGFGVRGGGLTIVRRELHNATGLPGGWLRFTATPAADAPNRMPPACPVDRYDLLLLPAATAPNRMPPACPVDRYASLLRLTVPRQTTPGQAD